MAFWFVVSFLFYCYGQHRQLKVCNTHLSSIKINSMSMLLLLLGFSVLCVCIMYKCGDRPNDRSTHMDAFKPVVGFSVLCTQHTNFVGVHVSMC